ncbi:tyrosine-type recombinase/integrase [bacterium]|nr:tyrosine-type recombinase/integrase [bacterium]
MARRQKKIIQNKRNRIYQGHFRLGDEEPGHPGRRLKLCSFDEAYYKETHRGQVKRSDIEIKRYLNHLYQERLEYLLAEKAEQDRKQKSPLMGELMREWIETRKDNRAPRTIKESQYLLRDYVSVNDDHPVADLDEHHVNHLKNYYRSRGNKDATLNKKLRELQTFLNWVYEKEIFPRPFKIEKIRETRQKPHILSHEQEERLLKRILGLIEKPNGKERRFGYYTHLRVYMVLAHTGLRRSELLHLKIEDIDLHKGVLLIKDDAKRRQDGDQHRVKERKEKKVPISESLHGFLVRDLGDRNQGEVYYLDNGYGEMYFEWADSLTGTFAKHLQALGIKGVKPLHGFRATVASRLINEVGTDISHVQEILGHSDVSTTLLYKDHNMIPLKKAVSSLSNGATDIVMPSLNNKEQD